MAMHIIFSICSQIEAREAEQNNEQAIRCPNSLLLLCVVFFICLVDWLVFVCLFVVHGKSLVRPRC